MKCRPDCGSVFVWLCSRMRRIYQSVRENCVHVFTTWCSHLHWLEPLILLLMRRYKAITVSLVIRCIMVSDNCVLGASSPITSYLSWWTWKNVNSSQIYRFIEVIIEIDNLINWLKQSISTNIFQMLCEKRNCLQSKVLQITFSHIACKVLHHSPNITVKIIRI